VIGVAAAAIAFGAAQPVMAQAHPFVYSFVPDAPPLASPLVIYADVGYGRDLFSALGPERFEQRVGGQVALGRRVTVLAQLGLAANDDAVVSRTTAQAELVASALPQTSRAILAFGVGGIHDYSGTGVALGRAVVGFRTTKSLVAGNLRLERPFTRAGGTRSLSRDALDVITTVGFTREISTNVRLGVESVAEDLEGFFEPDEAEGGAKLMLGPSVGLGHRSARWSLTVAGGPVVQLTRSNTSPAGGAVRDLATRSGYVIRTSFGYRW
jgi:hypothetical protein